MDKVLVTAICSAGVAFACALVLAWRDTEVDAVSDPGPDDTRSVRLAEGLRLAAAVAAAGVGGGLLTFGLGGRLMMRILAATSPDARGFVTDAEERVGEVTTGGTIGLVIFIGIASAVPAGVYLLLRSWLPRRSVVAGLVAGGIGGGLLARPSGLVDPDNRDFAILTPTWLAVLLCVGVIALGSVTIAVLVDRWVGTWSALSLSPHGLIAALPLLIYAIPPITLIGVVLVASRLIGSPRPGRARVATTALTSLAGIAGGAWIALSATQILI